MRRILIVFLGAGIGLTLVLLLWPTQDVNLNNDDRVDSLQASPEDVASAVESQASGQRLGSAPQEEGVNRSVDTTGDADALVVAFPDDESIEIVVRDPVHPHWQIPESLSQAYDALRQKAEDGDAESSLVLAATLENCRYSPRTQEALDSKINKLYETHTVKDSEGKVIAEVDTSRGIEPIEASLRQSFVRCEGISESQMAESGRWLELAASQGNEMARSTLFNRNPRDAGAFDAAERHWQAGGVQALRWLATYYRGSFGGDIVPRDPIKSFAYQYLATHILLAKLHNDGRVSSVFEAQELDELRIQGSRLSPLDHDAAIELAKSMLRENKNCCVSW